MSGDVIGMDWSKRPGQLDLSVNVDHIGDQSMWDAKNFIVVHGAG